MRILIACEFSTTVRDAFRVKGHEAISCDLLPSLKDRKPPIYAKVVYRDSKTDPFHIIGDVRKLLNQKWDMMIAFPPCTYLANSGARWFNHPSRIPLQLSAIQFVEELWNSNIPKIAIENPLGILSTKFRKPSQIIHPWMFGNSSRKSTCLWLKRLPLLRQTKLVPKASRVNDIHMHPRTPDRAKLKSVTFTEIAKAMAEQWG